MNGESCADFLDRIVYLLDNELDAGEIREVRLHLDECAPCLRQYGLEQVVKSLVARCCGNDPAPIDLRDRVLLRIQQVRIEIDHVEYQPE